MFCKAAVGFYELEPGARVTGSEIREWITLEGGLSHYQSYAIGFHSTIML